MTNPLLNSAVANADLPNDVYKYSFSNIEADKADIKLSEFKGKLILIVNTASLCGFTNQYFALQELYERYKNRGLIVIAVPSNDFGNQEPGHNTEIHNSCVAKFNITFPMTAKVKLKGKQIEPFFQYVQTKLGMLAGPNWNFYKYIISPQGQLITWYSSMTEPNSEKFMKIIEDNLPE